ncbi:MAG: hypothetical protein QXE13_04730 [Sulfolobales archaeon]
MSWIKERGILQSTAILLMLAVIGAALAMWSDTLKVAVTVDTGEVDVEFDNVWTDDPQGAIDPGYDKDVATCYAEIVEIEDEEGNMGGDNDLDLNITIVNGYPSYRCTVYFVVKNTGTIPVKGPHVYVVSDNSFSSYVEYSHNMTEVQIDPGGSEVFQISFHVTQSASENETYTLQLKLLFHQWNEEP